MTSIMRRLLVLLLLAPSVLAATFTVSSSLDSGPGTLRQAILDANANAGVDQIVFTVAAVTVNTPLPDITDRVDIDGTVSGSPVMISGPAGQLFTCNLSFTFGAGSSGSTLHRVHVAAACGAGVRIDTLVTNVTVTSSLLPSSVTILGDDNLITDSATETLRVEGDRNEAYRNDIAHVSLQTADGTQIGSIGNGNDIELLTIFASVNTIVEGNTFTPGPVLSPLTSAIQILPGMLLANSFIRNNVIHGYQRGITMFADPPSSSGFAFSENSIYDIVLLPIDLNIDGTTPNDPAPDADIGANNLQNFPVLATAILSPAQLVVTGTLASVPLTTYRIELFGNPAEPEARTFLGAFDVTTDATGNAAFTGTVSTLPAAGNVVTATATNRTTNDTSELSAAVIVDAPTQLGFTVSTVNVDESAGTVTLTVQRTGGSDNTITVDFLTVNGTATAPSDFGATQGTLTFGPGVTSRTIVVSIVDDMLEEPAESFTVQLRNPTPGVTLGTSTVTVTIASNLAENVPTLSQWSLIALALGLAVAMVVRAR